MSSASAAIEISHVALTVRDLPSMERFYSRALGLSRLRADPGSSRLGVGDRMLVERRKDRPARSASRREAGWFHAAFLLPDRRALANWSRHAADTGLRL